MDDVPVVSAAMRSYYDDRAAEYDDWWLGTGLFASRERPGWHEAVAELVAFVAGPAPARVLDVACGTAFLTRHLRGEVTARGRDRRRGAARESLVRRRGRVVQTAHGLKIPATLPITISNSTPTRRSEWR
jgi:hypothetical protein